MIDAQKKGEAEMASPYASDYDKVRKPATVAVQRYIIVFAAVMDFKLVI